MREYQKKPATFSQRMNQIKGTVINIKEKQNSMRTPYKLKIEKNSKNISSVRTRNTGLKDVAKNYPRRNRRIQLKKETPIMKPDFTKNSRTNGNVLYTPNSGTKITKRKIRMPVLKKDRPTKKLKVKLQPIIAGNLNEKSKVKFMSKFQNKDIFKIKSEKKVSLKFSVSIYLRLINGTSYYVN